MSIVRFRRADAAVPCASFRAGRPVFPLSRHTGAADTVAPILPPLRWERATGDDAAALQAAVLAGELHAAMLPASAAAPLLPGGLVVAAVLPRDEAREALILAPARPREWRDRPFAALPFGARVGIFQPRQAVQLRDARPDLRFGRPGSTTDALASLRNGDLAAVLVSGDAVPSGSDAVLLEPTELVPGTAAGASVLVAREDDRRTRQRLRLLDDGPTRLALATEQKVLSRLGAAAGILAAASARLDGGILQLAALVADPTRNIVVRRNLRATALQADQLAAALARKLREAVPTGLLG